ncbi:hypothetical protein Q8A50_04490 [Leuconostoc mesenteroides]|uniref:Uncharacterized protein n=1 Tax=Leuconostoc mesenteroides subsp. mesenteroides (strain ATCC 8293 / DSM 20343 / BCRC 11652 / CCM 1803 / JCM 6124 / NCDO 523 / NBRC 100496 / NCIMB 8023 / NCTC 12954 / NRRL B-1118 / 37Y) TaxID=203120 RepID=Q03XE9_LEUMM|nr:hypothetical protein [Leuconostoc mesenteroides]ABJ62123.1 hypothetical protein LEUM_1023 [Leuconostoc mesenteroides subsp. mesenteroides ATCC 8293]MDG9747164.1 hypothetical protein [Leuconostoc mesenteroides]MDP0486819.1 hypothetical protein [Leuconostoc mesenteroides]QQB31073.1 hypothetical protein I6H90_09600 [Leuconostoc mesenteroides]STY37190.1 Uncharacterised protein [Leuconostoc mesenteroides]
MVNKFGKFITTSKSTGKLTFAECNLVGANAVIAKKECTLCEFFDLNTET